MHASSWDVALCIGREVITDEMPRGCATNQCVYSMCVYILNMMVQTLKKVNTSVPFRDYFNPSKCLKAFSLKSFMLLNL